MLTAIPEETNHNQEELKKAYQVFLSQNVFILTGPKDTGAQELQAKIRLLGEIAEAGAGAVAGAGDEEKKAFIINSGAHWTVYTTTDNGKTFEEVKILGDGYCGLTSALYVHDFLQEPGSEKPNLLSQLKDNDNISSPTGEGRSTLIAVKNTPDLKGAYYITSTHNTTTHQTQKISKDDLEKISGKIQNDKDLKTKIQNLSISAGTNQGHWLDSMDVQDILKAFNNNLKILGESDAETISTFARKTEDLKAQKARADFFESHLSASSSAGSPTQLITPEKIDELFPGECSHIFDCTTEEFQQLYKPILEKLIESYQSASNKSDYFVNLLSKIERFKNASATKVKREAKTLEFQLQSALQSETRARLGQASPAASLDQEVVKKLAETKKRVEEKNINEDTEIYYKELNLQNNLNLFVSKNLLKLDTSKEDDAQKKDQVNKKFLEEKLPDAFQPTPKKQYQGWGIKVEYNKNDFSLTFKGSANEEHEKTHRDKKITHIDGMLIKEFLELQKKLSESTKKGDGIKSVSENIPDEYYIAHYFRTAKEVTLTFNNNSELKLTEDDKKIYQIDSTNQNLKEEIGTSQQQLKEELKEQIKKEIKEKILRTERRFNLDPSPAVSVAGGTGMGMAAVGGTPPPITK